VSFTFLPHCLPGWRELPAIFSGSSLYRAGFSTVAGTHKTEMAAIYRTGGRCRGAASFSGMEVTALGSVISVQAHQRATSSSGFSLVNRNKLLCSKLIRIHIHYYPSLRRLISFHGFLNRVSARAHTQHHSSVHRSTGYHKL
jgi:hypothetical protein